MDAGQVGLLFSLLSDFQVLEDGSVVKVNTTTVYDKKEGGKGFSFVHTVQKTKKDGSEDTKEDNDIEEEVPEENEDDKTDDQVEGEEQNEIFSNRK